MMRNGFIDVNIDVAISRAIVVDIFQSEDACYADLSLLESVIREFAFNPSLCLEWLFAGYFYFHIGFRWVRVISAPMSDRLVKILITQENLDA